MLIPFLRKLIPDKAETAPIEATTFLEPHRMIRKANKISSAARPVRVELDEEPCIGFFVYYDNDQTAEVSWSFVRELPPKSSQK